MKLLKKIFAAALAVITAAGTVCTALAYSPDSSSRDADVLYTLGLIQGSDSGYDLERAPTRAESAILTLRLAGLEGKTAAKKHPFTDVPAWADDCISLAYSEGIINGASGRKMNFSSAATENDFAAMLLRALGYTESSCDYSLADAPAFAERMGICKAPQAEVFTRANMFAMARSALSARLKGKNETLIEKLVACGAVERAKANAVGLPLGRELSGAEIYDRCISSVFLMTFYENERALQLSDPSANASGFFVSSSGLAVSNYHAFTDSNVATVTLNNGEVYRVIDILSYDKDSDFIVFRVSRTTLDGKSVTSAFPCVEYVRSSEVKNGETVYAIGSPLTLQGSISSGIVSYTARTVEGFSEPMIQNTAPISKGNSGGVLVNARGQAIGSTCAYFIYGQNINLAIPLDRLFEMDLSAKGISIAEMHAIVGPDEENVA